ncbi:hypothetical protein [Austwickia sp. TVS 96-490-7B]|nr:hypothetical protein [Austwickia sp. TVS 96-490-7B]
MARHPRNEPPFTHTTGHGRPLRIDGVGAQGCSDPDEGPVPR